MVTGPHHWPLVEGLLGHGSYSICLGPSFPLGIHIIVSDVVGAAALAWLGCFSLNSTVGPPAPLSSSQLSGVSLAHICLVSAHRYPHAPQASALWPSLWRA